MNQDDSVQDENQDFFPPKNDRLGSTNKNDSSDSSFKRQSNQLPKKERKDSKPNPFSESKDSVAQAWARYVHILGISWKEMSLERQIEFVYQTCQVITAGLAVVALSFLYSYLPMYIRLVLVPILIFGAWWLGGRFMAPVVLERLNKYLNK